HILVSHPLQRADDFDLRLNPVGIAIKVQQPLLPVRRLCNQLNGHAAQWTAEVHVGEVVEQNRPVMPAEVSEGRLQKQRELDALALELSEPASLCGEHPAQQTSLLAAVPPARQFGNRLRDV